MILIFKMDNKKLLNQITEEFLVDKIGNSDRSQIRDIQKLFQKELRTFYLESGIPKNIEEIIAKNSNIPIDIRILDFVAKKAQTTARIPQIAKQIPKFSRKYKNSGFECTLATAMLRLAFKQAKIKYTRSVLLEGHFITAKFLKDNSIALYDPSTTHTINGTKHGFYHLFKPEEVVEKNIIEKKDNQKGIAFVIKTKDPVENTGMFANKSLTKSFYAYEPSILIDIAVVLENLSEYKNHKDTDSVELLTKFPVLKQFDYPKLRRELHLFDAHDYL